MLVGAFVPNCVEFIVGRLKLGMLRFIPPGCYWLVFYSTLFLVTEAFTGGVVRITSICTFVTDGSPGAERIFVIAAVVCGAFKTCHKSVLLIIMILPETVSLPECASFLIVSTAVRLDRFRCCIVCPEEEKFILKK